MSSTNWCPVFRPTKQEFEQPFVEYVSNVFRQEPNLPMFKVVPPQSWRPRKAPFPDLKAVRINTPIKQHVFGTKGAYRCLLVEQKEMSVADFKRHAYEEAQRLSGHKGQAGSASAAGVAEHTGSRLQARKALHAEDELQERSFWSSVTLNPPLYGADTPQSFFDKSLPYGWNLRNLGDLLKHKDVPDIPGVTTPMTYFGMWRSFFSWHKEDADLLSINYLHFGAPKVWYSIPPSDSAKFDRMAMGLFPELARSCSAFVRHKDILVSPSLLRTHNIKYLQAKQQPGEFVILNAASYHAGFNMGFNCAEAINFATPDWVAAGKAADRCTCEAMRDCVRITAAAAAGGPSTPTPPPVPDRRITRALAAASRLSPAAAPQTPTSKPGPGSGARPGTPRAPPPSPLTAPAQDPPGSPASLRPTLLPHAPQPSRLGSGGLGGAGGGAPLSLDAIRIMSHDEVVGEPVVIVGESSRGRKFFNLVQRIQRAPSQRGQVVLRWLRESEDGLFRPVPTYWEEAPHALVPVRTQLVTPAKLGPGGRVTRASVPAFKLLTLRSRILDTDLVD
ncbi:JmjC domain, hydroxylase-domain-containing protein [Haematococcus lacustris]